MSEIDDLLELWEINREQGIQLPPQHLCRDNPELLNELRQQIEALIGFERQFGNGHSDATDRTHPLLENTELRSGQSVLVDGRYQVERLHATGGLGLIYEATDLILNRRVARFPNLMSQAPISWNVSNVKPESRADLNIRALFPSIHCRRVRRLHRFILCVLSTVRLLLN